MIQLYMCPKSNSLYISIHGKADRIHMGYIWYALKIFFPFLRLFKRFIKFKISTYTPKNQIYHLHEIIYPLENGQKSCFTWFLVLPIYITIRPIHIRKANIIDIGYTWYALKIIFPFFRSFNGFIKLKITKYTPKTIKSKDN